MENIKRMFKILLADSLPVISAATAAQHPRMVELLEMLKNLFTDDSIRELSYRVDVLHQNPADATRGFLIWTGLTS